MLFGQKKKKGNNSSDIDVGEDDEDDGDDTRKTSKAAQKSQGQYVIEIEKANMCNSHDGKSCIVLPGGRGHYQLTKSDKSLWAMMLV